jgi:outer membrane receptor protein involved in Fe transport
MYQSMTQIAAALLRRGMVTFSLLSLATFALAQEQETGPPVAQLQKKTGDVEEVTVTARKKEESLQDVPISITALTAETLKARRINNAYDVAAFTPNFNFAPNLGRRLDAPTIRGQFGPLVGTEPNASFFVDGVFTAGSISSTSTANLERVEVLRGPQSALFGRATFAGAVNYITRKPTDDFEGEINAEVGEDKRQEYGAWASGPIVEDQIYFFVGGNYDSWEGEWRNGLEEGQANSATLAQPFSSFFWRFNEPRPGDPPCPAGSRNAAGTTDPADGQLNCAPQVGDNSKVGGEETKTGTVKLLFTPFENLEITGKYERSEADDDHFVYLFAPPLETNNCFNRIPDPGDPLGNIALDPNAGTRSPGWVCGSLTDASYKPSLNLPNFRRGVTVLPPSASLAEFPNGVYAPPAPFIGLEESLDRYLLDVVYDVSDYTFTARYSREDRDSEYVRDLERSYALGPAATGLFESYRNELREFDSWEFLVQSPVDGPIYWKLGYYYYDFEETAFQRDFTGFSRFALSEGAGGTTRNTAWFGSIEWTITDKLTLSFDGRYAEDEIARVSPEFDFPDGSGQVQTIEAQETFYSFSPRFIARYFVHEDLSTYFSLAQGNKPGGFNFAFFDGNVDPSEADNPNIEIDEEDAWTWEIGAKGTFFDGRLQANGAVFYIDWTNQAINEVACIDDIAGVCEPNNIVKNAGESEVIGAEVEASWFATEYLSFTLGYGYTDSELEEYVDDEFAVLQCPEECYEADANGNLTPQAQALRAELGDVSGNKSPRAPEHNLNLSGLYMRPLNSTTDWYWRHDLLYESKQYSTASNLTYSPSLWVWNSRLGIETDSWSASVFVNNITDEKSPLQIQNFPVFDNTIGYLSSGQIYQNAFQLLPRQSRYYGATVGYRFGGN